VRSENLKMVVFFIFNKKLFNLAALKSFRYAKIYFENIKKHFTLATFMLTLVNFLFRRCLAHNF